MPSPNHRSMGIVVVALGLVALAQGADPAPVESAAAPERPSVPDSAAARALREGRPMELNGATAADLELLPRIGPTLAQRIVTYRSEHGRFNDVRALTLVRGIGPRTIERLRPLLVVDSGPAAGPQNPPDPGVGAPVDLRQPASPGM